MNVRYTTSKIILLWSILYAQITILPYIGLCKWIPLQRNAKAGTTIKMKVINCNIEQILSTYQFDVDLAALNT